MVAYILSRYLRRSASNPWSAFLRPEVVRTSQEARRRRAALKRMRLRRLRRQLEQIEQQLALDENHSINYSAVDSYISIAEATIEFLSTRFPAVFQLDESMDNETLR